MLQTPGAYTLTLGDRVLTESKDGVSGDYVVSYDGRGEKGRGQGRDGEHGI